MNSDIVPACFVVAVVFFFHFIPTIVAWMRSHYYFWPIAIINLFLGWSLIGWVGALVWAIWPQEYNHLSAVVAVHRKQTDSAVIWVLAATIAMLIFAIVGALFLGH